MLAFFIAALNFGESFLLENFYISVTHLNISCFVLCRNILSCITDHDIEYQYSCCFQYQVHFPIGLSSQHFLFTKLQDCARMIIVLMKVVVDTAIAFPHIRWEVIYGCRCAQ